MNFLDLIYNINTIVSMDKYMFYKPFKKTIKPQELSVLHTELNEHEQEKISGGATYNYLAGLPLGEEGFFVTPPTSTKDPRQ